MLRVTEWSDETRNVKIRMSTGLGLVGAVSHHWATFANPWR